MVHKETIFKNVLRYMKLDCSVARKGKCIRAKSVYIGQQNSFNNQTGPILVQIYPLINNNLHVKYRINLIRTF